MINTENDINTSPVCSSIRHTSPSEFNMDTNQCACERDEESLREFRPDRVQQPRTHVISGDIILRDDAN